jgi:hypothetical protein
MSREQRTMSKAKKKTCLDCLHCKVSVRSTVNNRLCFCSETEKKERHREMFWQVKKVCKQFVNMGEKV